MSRSFAVITGLLAAVALGACSKPEPRPEPIRSVRTVLVAPAAAGGTQEYAAEIRARTEVRLGFRVGGKMISRQAEVGQRVRAGEVLARLDPQDLRLGQDAALAAVQSAQVNHDLMLADFRRFKDLRDQGFISSAELERREAALKAAVAQLDQARSQASVQRNQAGYADLVASSAGIVVAVDAEPGAVLAAGASVVRVAVDGPRDAVFSVPEDAVASARALLSRAGAVGVRLWGSSERLPGTVREVAAAADPVTRTFLVKAELAAPAASLGQSATVLIELPRSDRVTLLPLSAVREHKGRSAVWIVDPATMVVRAREVEVAGAQGNELIIKSGVAPGDRVVTAGVHVLNDGQSVRLLSAAAPVQASAASR